MKVRVTIEVDERDRRAINQRHGRPGLASYGDVKAELRSLLTADLETQRQECCDFHNEGGADADPCRR